MKLYQLIETDQFSGKEDRIATTAIFRHWKGDVEVLLEQRKAPPDIGLWSLPGGHAHKGEELMTAALRELKEETGIKLNYLLKVKGSLAPPDRGKDEHLFTAVVDPETKFKATSDAMNLKWCNIGDLPEMAFHHEALVYDALAEAFGTDAPLHEAVRNIVRKYHGPLLPVLTERKKRTKAGTLIVFEGIDGAGKTMQVNMLSKWIKDQGYDLIVSRWNSSDLLSKTIRKAKHERMLSPLLYSLLHAADMAVRYEHDILPAIEDDDIVICDRYIYTSMARDQVRGIDLGMLKKVYKDFRDPDILFHCSIPVHSAFTRVSHRDALSYYSSGKDLDLADTREDSYMKYSTLVHKAYNELLPDMPNYHKIKMNRTPATIAKEIVDIVAAKLGVTADHDDIEIPNH